MDQVEVDVARAEPGEASVERAQRGVVAVVVIPQLGRDEHLVARHAAGPDRGADIGLVAVDPRGVDVAVAELQRGGDGVAGRRAGELFLDRDSRAAHVAQSTPAEMFEQDGNLSALEDDDEAGE